MNILDIVRRVQTDLGRGWDLAGNEYIINQLLDAYRDLVIENNWSFLLKEGKIRLYAYKALTVSSWVNSTKVVNVDEAITAEDALIYDDHKVYIPKIGSAFTVTAVTAGAAGLASITLAEVPLTRDNGEAKVIPTANVTTGSLAGDTITYTAHGYSDGEPVIYNNAGGASITGLTSGTIYYVYASTEDTFKLTAVPNTIPAITFTGTGNNAQYFKKESLADGDTIYLFVGDYALPTDCAYNKEISIVDENRMQRLAKSAEPTISKATYSQRYLMDDPLIYFAKSRERIMGTTNYNYIGFWPFLNPTAKYLSIWYYRKPFGNFDTFVYTGGTATTAAHTLIEVPDEFSHWLYWKTMEICYYKLNDSRMGYAMQKEMDILHSLKNANNGDAAMERVISEYPPSGYPEGDYDMPFTNGILSVRVV